MMRVLFLVECPIGGVSKHLLDLMDGIHGKAEMTVIYGTNRVDKRFIDFLDRHPSIGKEEIPTFKRNINPLNDILSFYAILKLIRKYTPCIVHTHSSKAGFLGRIASKIISRKIKTIYTPHGLSTNISKSFWILEKIASYFTDYIIAVSDTEREYIIKHNIISEDKVVLINNGISISEGIRNSDDTIRSKYSIKKNDIIVATVGRITYAKNPLMFARVANEIIQKYDNVYFLWIGMGELVSKLNKFISTNKLEGKFIITGWTTNVMSILSETDIFILTSRYESFGYVTCEAMLSQKPVVVTDIPGSKSMVIDGWNGFITNKDAIGEFSKCIEILIKHPGLRSEMGQNGYNYVVNNFNKDKMIDETLQLYSRVID